MMRYLSFPIGPQFHSPFDLAKVLVAFNERGDVTREIGLGPDHQILHRYPSTLHRFGNFGLFDSPPLDVDRILGGTGAIEEVSESEFEALWATPFSEPTGPYAREPNVPSRLRKWVLAHLGNAEEQ